MNIREFVGVLIK